MGNLFPQTQPVYRYPLAHLFSRVGKQGVALDLLHQGIKPRHIRKCIGISNRQLKKAKNLYRIPTAEQLGVVGRIAINSIKANV